MPLFEPNRGHNAPNSRQNQGPKVHDPRHVGPSGRYYPHAHIHTEVQPHPAYFGNVYRAAHTVARLHGITNFEVWVSETSPNSVTVTLGAMNPTDYARLVLGVHGDSQGSHVQRHNFTNCTPEYQAKWTASAVQVLSDNSISCLVIPKANSREFHFGLLSDFLTFQIAISGGVIDKLTHGENISTKLPNIKPGPKLLANGYNGPN